MSLRNQTIHPRLRAGSLQLARTAKQQRVPFYSDNRSPLKCNASAATADKVLKLGKDLGLQTMPKEIDAYVDELASKPLQPKIANAALKSQGVWEVFYAPHIRGLGSVLMSRVQPVQYELSGDEMVAHVCLTNGLFGTVWLSNSAQVVAKEDGYTIKVNFQKFWVDRGDAPRDYLEEEASVVDKVLGAVGRLLFNLEGGEFPVRYLDRKLAVFEFPLAKTNVAIRKIK